MCRCLDCYSLGGEIKRQRWTDRQTNIQTERKLNRQHTNIRTKNNNK